VASKSIIIPSLDELKRLPRWARVALCARTTRRIQPLFLEAWPQAPAKYHENIEAAIAEGELAASQGKRTAGLYRAGIAAMDVYGKSPDKIRYARDEVDDVPQSASRVALAGLENDAIYAHDGLAKALSAVAGFEKVHRLKGLAKLVGRLLWQDFQHLETAAKAGKWNNSTPVASDAIGPLWPEGPPPAWPVSASPRRRKPKTSPAKPALKEFRLPKDLTAFLKSGNRLKYSVSKSEVGPIQLKALDELSLNTFDVRTEGTPAHADDPNGRKQGHYVVRAVDLVAECDAYGPEGILAWLVDAKLFAQWDPDHLRLIIFPKATWSQIVAKPARYLDAQWNDFENFARYAEPWKHGKFSRAKR
jgi:hypothetical protein